MANFITRGYDYDIMSWHENVSAKPETVSEVYLSALRNSSVKGGNKEIIVDIGCGTGVFTLFMFTQLMRNHIFFGVDKNVKGLDFLKSRLHPDMREELKATQSSVEGALKTDVSRLSKVFIVHDDNLKFVECLPENSVNAVFNMFPGPQYSAEIPGLTVFGNRLVAEFLTLKYSALLFCKTMKALKPGGTLLVASTVRASDWNNYKTEINSLWSFVKLLEIPYKTSLAGAETKHVQEFTEKATDTQYKGTEKQWIHLLKITKTGSKKKKAVNKKLEEVLEKEYLQMLDAIDKNVVHVFPRENTVNIGGLEYTIVDEGFV